MNMVILLRRLMMQNVKCLKCNWKGSSVDTMKQWFKSKTMDRTEELLMICPDCKVGVCVENKRGKQEVSNA